MTDQQFDEPELSEATGNAAPARKSRKSSAPSAKDVRRPGTKRDVAAQATREKDEAKRSRKVAQKDRRSPSWWAPVMCTLMIIGLIVVVLAYVTGGRFPIPGWNNGNLFLGFGFMIVGFLMTMGWK